jgi:hypothetical protein
MPEKQEKWRIRAIFLSHITQLRCNRRGAANRAFWDGIVKPLAVA